MSEHANGIAHPNSPDAKAVAARLADAKGRICLYASPETIEKFSKFETLGAIINSPAQFEAFTEMVASMRKDSATSGQARLKDLEVILIGVRSNDT